MQTTYPKMNNGAVQFYQEEQKNDRLIFGNSEAGYIWMSYSNNAIHGLSVRNGAAGSPALLIKLD